MPHQLTKTAYYFSELSDSAKENARGWYRQFVFSYSSDWKYVYQDAEECATILGIEIDRRTYRTVGGGTGTEPCIFFSGFSSQGDGASLEGTYRYKPGAAKAIRQHAGRDAELWRIADGLQTVQRKHFYKLEAKSKVRGHYSHYSGCMDVEVSNPDHPYDDIGNAEQEVTRLLRDFADWIYQRLSDEYDYQSSDEAIDEALGVGGYDFDEDGKRVVC